METILLIGRSKCIHTKELKSFLKRRIKKLYFIESRNIGERLKLSKFLKQNVDLIISFRSFYILKKKRVIFVQLWCHQFSCRDTRI